MATPSHEIAALESLHPLPGSLAVQDGPTQPLASLVQVFTHSIYAMTWYQSLVVPTRCRAIQQESQCCVSRACMSSCVCRPFSLPPALPLPLPPLHLTLGS